MHGRTASRPSASTESGSLGGGSPSPKFRIFFTAGSDPVGPRRAWTTAATSETRGRAAVCEGTGFDPARADFEGICRATPARRGSFEANAEPSVDGALDFWRHSTETIGPARLARRGETRRPVLTEHPLEPLHGPSGANGVAERCMPGCPAKRCSAPGGSPRTGGRCCSTWRRARRRTRRAAPPSSRISSAGACRVRCWPSPTAPGG
jgi:hypothetical protein